MVIIVIMLKLYNFINQPKKSQNILFEHIKNHSLVWRKLGCGFDVSQLDAYGRRFNLIIACSVQNLGSKCSNERQPIEKKPNKLTPKFILNFT